jgi:hypothetical protein
MDVPALACGRLYSLPRAGASGADLGGDLRELLFLDDAMWAEDDVETPPPGEPRRDVLAQGGAHAPAGVRDSARADGGGEEQSAAADGGHAHVCSHPLWPVLWRRPAPAGRQKWASGWRLYSIKKQDTDRQPSMPSTGRLLGG